MIEIITGAVTLIGLGVAWAVARRRRAWQEETYGGAEEDYGDELAAMRDMEPDERLITTAEMLALVHADLDVVHQAFLSDLDNICDEVINQLDPAWARVDMDTREWPMVRNEHASAV